MAPTSQSTVLSSKLGDRLRSCPFFFCLFVFFFLFVVSGIQAAAMPACGSESPPNPSKDLTWFQSKAISGIIGTCRSVLPRPSPSSPSVSVPLTQLYSSSSLQLLSCWTGLKHWTAAGGPPDVGYEPKTYYAVSSHVWTVFAVCKSTLYTKQLCYFIHLLIYIFIFLKCIRTAVFISYKQHTLQKHIKQITMKWPMKYLLYIVRSFWQLMLNYFI